MSVYKNKNGKWYCRFQVKGVRHHYLCSTAKTKQEALNEESILRSTEIKKQMGILPIDTDVKLETLYKNYLTYSKVNKKTYDRDLQRIKIIKKIWKNKTYSKDITRLDIERLKKNLIDMGRSKSTVNKYLQIISKMYNLAIEYNLAEKNPVKSEYKFSINNQQIRYLTPDEEFRLYKNANILWRGILLIALNSGLRLSNIRLLQWHNVNMEYRIFDITINKTNKHIKLYINDVLYNYFKDRIGKPNDYVFTINGKPLTMNQFQSQWRMLKKRSNIIDLRFHDLRHTVGTRLAKNGVPVNVIKEVMAHTNISTTMRYVHYASEQLQNALHTLENNNVLNL